MIEELLINILDGIFSHCKPEFYRRITSYNLLDTGLFHACKDDLAEGITTRIRGKLGTQALIQLSNLSHQLRYMLVVIVSC